MPAGNAGVSEGAPMNFTDIMNTGLSLRQNLKGDTLAAKRLDEAKKLVTPTGPTAGSLIKGLLPGRLGGSGGGGPSALSITGGGGGQPRFTPVEQQPIEEPLIPLLQSGQQQSGQDSTALADLTKRSYTQALRRYGIDPGYFARIQQRRFKTKPNSFRRSFIRNYF